MFGSLSSIGSQYLYSNSSSGSSRKSGAELDKDAFLRLLVTQLRYQDPLSPMENTEFVSQMAQFSTLEQVTNMARSLESFLVNFSWTQFVSLIGKSVKFTDSETGKIVEGKVTGIKPASDGIVLIIDNGKYEVPLNSIEEIKS